MLQSLVQAIYPPQCMNCGGATQSDFGLCGSCWREARFLEGLVCNHCGLPQIGEAADGEIVLCDDCLTIARPWSMGRAVFLYEGTGRSLVMKLKHGDRTDLARALAPLLLRAATPLVGDEAPILVPIPIHWSRLLKRRYNQSALLAQAMARQSGWKSLPDALVRVTRTPTLEGRTRTARFEILDRAIRPHPRHARSVSGRQVLLLDDVMTSGATLAAATEALHAAGASRVCTLVLARVAKSTYI